MLLHQSNTRSDYSQHKQQFLDLPDDTRNEKMYSTCGAHICYSTAIHHKQQNAQCYCLCNIQQNLPLPDNTEKEKKDIAYFMKSQRYCNLAHYKEDNQKCLACNEDFIVHASNGYSEDQIEKQKYIIKFHTVAKASLEKKIIAMIPQIEVARRNNNHELLEKLSLSKKLSENSARSYQSNINHAQENIDHAQKKIDLKKSSPKKGCVIS